MKEILLQILKESKDYVSGQELCDRLNVSRTAIWKAINGLKEAGYEIDAVRNRGYRLVTCPDVLLADEVKSQLDTKWFGNRILYFDTIDSTNNEVKRQAETGAENGLLVIAEEQTGGRGRRGRTWVSPKGTGIWHSFLLRPDMTPEQASMLTLVAALAAAGAIREATGLDACIKWPNDIVVNGKKVTGILTEMSTEMTCINYVVIGIGINANMRNFAPEISDMATSLALESGRDVSRSSIIASLGKHFEEYYDIFCRTKDMSGLKNIYESRLVNIDKQVYIMQDNERLVRTAVGINAAGELLVQDEDGNVSAVRAGEVSVRGIYGYV